MIKINIKDQLGNNICLNAYPIKIVCCVPSITELLFYLGLDSCLIGVTKFCIFPHIAKSKQKIGGTKNVNINLVKNLKPDFIIANKEENIKDQIQSLSEIAPVYVSEIKNINDALKMIKDLGTITNKEKESYFLIEKIKSSLKKIIALKNKNALYLIWQKPFMTIGGDTYINDVMKKMGLKNVFKKQARYPIVNLEELGIKKLDYVLLSSEPYPFKEKHILKMQEYFPHSKIILVDGSIFSWYGNRMLLIKKEFKTLQTQLFI